MSDGRLPCCRNVRLASLYFATRLAVLRRTHRPCVPTGVVLLCWRRAPFAGHPTLRYSSRCTTTDAQTVRPYRSRIALLETDALSLDTRHFATRLAVLRRTHRPCVPTGVVLLCWRRAPFAEHDRASLYFATRLAVLQRTHRPCVPTGVVLLCWRRVLFG